MSLSIPEQYKKDGKNYLANDAPLTAKQKHDINEGLKLFPDENKFKGLNHTSKLALVTNKTVGAPVMAPTRIKNAPKSLGLS